MSKQLPKHVAVIMDGNGRWAKNQGKPRIFGHRQGAEPILKIVRASVELGVSTLTLFALSTENWQRPRPEVSALLELFVESLDEGISNLIEIGVRLKFFGDFSCFDDKVVNALRKSEARTENFDSLYLNVAINYSGRWEIAHAALAALDAQGLSAGAAVEEVEQALSDHLKIAPVDLLIRTGGERRLSNFLLWQSAYAELYFTDILWPDFTKEQYADALAWYAGRERRFGLTSEQVAGSNPKSAA